MCQMWRNLPTTASNFLSEATATFPDFVIENEHFFIRNIFDMENITLFKNIKTFESLV